MIPGIPAQHRQAMKRGGLSRLEAGFDRDRESLSVLSLGSLEVVLRPARCSDDLERAACPLCVTEFLRDLEALARKQGAGRRFAGTDGECRETEDRAGPLLGRGRRRVERAFE